MKNLGKHIGLAGFILFFIAIIFKHFHLQGAGVILLLGVASGIAYFTLSFFSKEIRSIGGIEQMNGLFISASMIIFLVSFLFKMMHWPGANVLLGLSMIFLVVFMIIAIVGIYSKDKKFNSELVNIYKFSILYMAAVMIMFGIRSYL